jgi:hypothetical protein
MAFVFKNATSILVSAAQCAARDYSHMQPFPLAIPADDSGIVFIPGCRCAWFSCRTVPILDDVVAMSRSPLVVLFVILASMRVNTCPIQTIEVCPPAW